ncbi:homeodomain-only protein-like [Acipenser oxyrinchus oxyrinchus]|uniref:Homeodomain-only protein n=1 Tax=Acipenser oxyrinchus oxyrinchus TaxID=40147 RepID=A0AAD8LU09_ACIOX|nr:homeodomain-only protein-like [Acipenser oxyrinchus oxyrinchus]
MSSTMESSRRNGDVMQDMNLAEDQIKALEENFMKVSKQPDEATLMLIAAECGLSEEITAKWFKLRYSKWRTSEGLPAVCGSVKD